VVGFRQQQEKQQQNRAKAGALTAGAIAGTAEALVTSKQHKNNNSNSYNWRCNRLGRRGHRVQIKTNCDASKPASTHQQHSSHTLWVVKLPCATVNASHTHAGQKAFMLAMLSQQDYWVELKAIPCACIWDDLHPNGLLLEELKVRRSSFNQCQHWWKPTHPMYTTQV
jgi:hypothetical protein